MKVKTIFCFLIALFVAVSSSAQERRPAVVSPGSDAGIAVVGQSCPTFSWTGVEWAAAYRVAVFESITAEALSYEEMEAVASPVLSKEIRGRALSWTPSSDERLSSGGVYVWYVRAADAFGTGSWSEGRVFTVEVESRFVGMEETVRERLKEHGVSDEVIDDVLRGLESGTKEAVVLGVGIKDGEYKTQDIVGIQGTEGTYNTFYGLDAGFSIEAGGYYNSFFGRSAGYSTTGGDYVTFMGYNAGYSNTTGNYNTFMGSYAGYSNTTGYSNTLLGHVTGMSNTTGYNNTFIGREAGYSNTTGYHNTFMGYKAGASNTSGHDNVFLGYYAGYYETGSHKLYIANSTTSSPLIYGEFDNDILAINGKLGVGTQSPDFPMHLKTSGTNAAFVVDRTDGATNYINATGSFGNFGTVNDYPLRLAVNSLWRMRLDSDNSLTMQNGASCTAGGIWQNASSRELKENIHSLTAEEAMDALKGLNPVKYNYKADKEEDCVGFIAEDVPDLVASKDRKGMSPMDVVAVLTKVVQEQQERDKEYQKIIDELRKEMDELKRKNK